jgi:hypothetical protein
LLKPCFVSVRKAVGEMKKWMDKEGETKWEELNDARGSQE